MSFIGRALGPSFAILLAGCCMSSSDSIVIEGVADPASEPLLVCRPTEMLAAESETRRCAAHSPVLTTADTLVYVSGTHAFAHFATGATLVVSTGDGMGRTEIERRAIARPSPPPGGGEATWTHANEVSAPPSGWPPGESVRFQLLDGSGAVAAESLVSFVGAPVAGPPARAIGVVRVCGDADVFGPLANRYCGTAVAAVAAGAGELWVTYSTDQAALVAAGFTTVLERRDGEAWTEIARDSLPPSTLTTGVFTLAGHYPLDAGPFRPPARWRARVETTAGAPLGEHEFQVD